MFPPIPAPFTGSVPHDFAADGRLARLLDRCFASAAVFTGLCAGAEAGTVQHATWAASLGIASVAMLLPAALGLWAIGRAGAWSSLSVSRLYDRVMQHLRSPAGSQAAFGAPESPIDSFAGLVAGTIQNLQRSRAVHGRTRDAARAAARALQAGRGHASRLATDLRGDGAAMADSASGIMASSARLAREAERTGSEAACTEDTVAKAAGQAAELAGSVRQVTLQIIRMTDVAAGAAQSAFGAQRHLAELDASARKLEITADQVSRALQMAAACGRQAEVQRASGAELPAGLAADLREMASGADAALTNMLAVVTVLRHEAAAANRRVTDLSALLRSQHELGDALSQSVARQGEDVAQVLGLIHEAHSGFAAVRAGVEAMGLRNNTQLANAEALRGSIARLPAHADTIAGILRAIPDFTSPMEP